MSGSHSLDLNLFKPEKNCEIQRVEFHFTKCKFEDHPGHQHVLLFQLRYRPRLVSKATPKTHSKVVRENQCCHTHRRNTTLTKKEYFPSLSRGFHVWHMLVRIYYIFIYVYVTTYITI